MCRCDDDRSNDGADGHVVDEDIVDIDDRCGIGLVVVLANPCNDGVDDDVHAGCWR